MALSILSMVFGVLMQIFSLSIRTVRLTEEYRTAVELAESQLTALEVERTLTHGTLGGDVDDKYYWQVTIEPYEEGPSLPFRLDLVTAEVFWGDTGRDDRSVSLTTLRLSRLR